jgi:hypothetical protein
MITQKKFQNFSFLMTIMRSARQNPRKLTSMPFAHFKSVFDEKPHKMSALAISIHCSCHLITELNIDVLLMCMIEAKHDVSTDEPIVRAATQACFTLKADLDAVIVYFLQLVLYAYALIFPKLKSDTGTGVLSIATRTYTLDRGKRYTL